MTDHENNSNDSNTAFQLALEAVRNAEDNPDASDQSKRILEALSFISYGTREIKSAVLNIRRRETH